jgi:hypothetical protein
MMRGNLALFQRLIRHGRSVRRAIGVGRRLDGARRLLWLDSYRRRHPGGRLERRDTRGELGDLVRQLLRRLGRVDALSRRVEPFFDPLADEVSGAHPGLAGQALEHPDATRVEPDRHRPLVLGPVELRARLVRPIPTGTWLIGPITTRGVWTPAAPGSAVAGLPIAAALGARRAVRAVAAITIGTLKTIWPAVGAASAVETHG